MTILRLFLTPVLCGTFALLFLMPGSECAAQKRPGQLRDFLLQFKGKEIQIIDNTGGTEQYASGGTEQYASGDPSKAYTLTLNEVESDYFVVSRNTATDKRTFIYPMSVIRRIIYKFDSKPYDRILLEMY